MSEWISVDDKMPPLNQVVIYSYGNTVECGYCYKLGDEIEWKYIDGPSINFEVAGVTHWMSKPNPPKG